LPLLPFLPFLNGTTIDAVTLMQVHSVNYQLLLIIQSFIVVVIAVDGE